MKKALIMIIILVSLLIVGAGAYAFHIYQATMQTVEDVYEEINRDGSERREEQLEMDEQEPVSILLLGIGDSPWAGEVARADTIMDWNGRVR